MVIADDSGLSIDYLGGKPGVYSARYAGEHKDDAENVEKVLSELQGIEKKTAQPDSDVPLLSAYREKKQRR